MLTLHLISQHEPAILQLIHTYFPQNNACLLLQEGVYVGLASTITLSSQSTWYALQADVAARGLTGLMSPTIQLINYIEWQALVTDHARTISW